MRKQSPEAVDREFFTALIEADADTLGNLLADDFLLIDVQPFRASSRYIRVLAGDGGRWRTVAAQGTQDYSPARFGTEG